MADTVTSRVLFAGSRHYVIQITNRSDSTGESAVVKIDKSTITGPNGKEPSKIVIERIKGIVDGMRVDLFWDHTSDVLIASLGGLGTSNINLSWTKYGGLVDSGTGDTGDVILTTNAASAGDSYDLTLYCRLVD